MIGEVPALTATIAENNRQKTFFAEDPLLKVQDLRIGFLPSHTPIAAKDASNKYNLAAAAVDGVSFSLCCGKVLCLVGESGCGKSVTALSILRLLASPPSVWMGGSIFFEGRNIAELSKKELANLRGNRIGMIFQDPMTSLNPVMRIGEQMIEGLCLHHGLNTLEANKLAVEMLKKVGISDPEQRVKDFPHQLSGGMRQRVMIGMALICNPTLLIADEPTTALDVTVQRQILALMQQLIRGSAASLLLITHDFDVVEQIADEVAVMYAGKIVEQGTVTDILQMPQHPYTQGLLASLPRIKENLTDKRQADADLQSTTPLNATDSPRHARLGAIAGVVPGLWSRPSGCSFHPRCPHAMEKCKLEAPDLLSLAPTNLIGQKNYLQEAEDDTPHLCSCWLKS